MDRARPLADVSVIEVNDVGAPLCVRLAASLAGRIAADLGADVLKIEPPGGDPVRQAPPHLPGGGSALFQFLNASKRSLQADLSSEQGREVLRRLLETADAALFEETAQVAGLVRQGPAAAIELAAFPVEMDAASRPVSELVVQALGGMMHMIGEPDRKPLRLAGHQASYAAGMTAYTGLAAALAARQASRPAPRVRVSLVEVMQWVNWKAASGAEANGVSPGREGQLSECQVVPCRDGYVALVYTTQWRAIRELIADPRLDAPEFSSRSRRRSNVGTLYDVLRPWFADKTRLQIQALAQARGVPFGPVFTPAELLTTEQYQARGFLAEVEAAASGRLRAPQLPVKWNGRTFAPAPAPGLETAEAVA
ncbi:MAG: CoA transferase [Phenylobacterium sp.]